MEIYRRDNFIYDPEEWTGHPPSPRAGRRGEAVLCVAVGEVDQHSIHRGWYRDARKWSDGGGESWEFLNIDQSLLGLDIMVS